MAKGNKTHGPVGFIKRFVGNKNTVTILGILACIATLIIGYNYRVKISINPLSVPYAKQTIPARTLITSDMIGNVKISKTYTSSASNLVTNPQKVVNKYASYKSAIPKNSLFYSEMLLEKEEMPDAVFSNIPNGFTIFSLDVSAKSTYFNSVRAGDYIDLYVSATDTEEDNKVIYSKLVESIRVLAVKDTKGNNIVKNRIENGKPAELLFAVKEEYYLLLMKAQFTDLNVTIEPVLRNDEYSKDKSDNDTQVTSQELQAFILDRCDEGF